jgi:hypothetical protein
MKSYKTVDTCANAQCPPGPFNRTCSTLKTQGQCCESYYCDDDDPDPEQCNVKRLQQYTCTRPPRDLIDCIIFKDPFGCCNKFQCEGGNKSSICIWVFKLGCRNATIHCILQTNRWKARKMP